MYSLDALHFMHTSLLNPSHDHLIIQHLAKIHASGRRSHVLDVGAVSMDAGVHSRGGGVELGAGSVLADKSQGTGAWALTVAEQHPYSDLVGIECVAIGYGA